MRKQLTEQVDEARHRVQVTLSYYIQHMALNKLWRESKIVAASGELSAGFPSLRQDFFTS